MNQREKGKNHSDTEISISTDGISRSKRRKNKRERPTFFYCRVSHLERYCFRNNMDIMTKILEENHIDLPEFARRWERKRGDGKPAHALCAWEKPVDPRFVIIFDN